MSDAPDYQAPFALPPGATEVVLCRHGSAATYSPATPFDLLGGQHDPSLTERGRGQAEALAERLASEQAIAALFCTPLRRTAETAVPLARRLGLEPVVVHDLREIFLGEWEAWGGLAGAPPELDAHRRRVLVEENWGLLPGGEDMASFGGRVRAGLEHVAATVGPDRVAVAMVHGGIVAETCHQLTGSRPFAFFATENASITRVIRDAAGHWVLHSFNDTAHLRVAVGPVSPGRRSEKDHY